MERKDSKRIFSGVSDETYDISASSAGEGNIGRILISILSFRRLKEKYKSDYKGGILLIDEIDATLHGFSQRKIVNFLWEQSEECKLQIIFTTHSANVLKEVNRLQRLEVKDKGITNLDIYDFENQIIHLAPEYSDDGVRCIAGKNINNAQNLRSALDDMQMKSTFVNQHIHLYTEDERSVSLLWRMFLKNEILLQSYVEHIDINLGWTNYCQLMNKGVPEFLSSMIVLDKDVENKKMNPEQKRVVNRSNVLYMPVDVERGLFEFLKQHSNFNKFKNILSEKGCNLSYDVCFSEWTEDEYDTNTLKKWFLNLEQSIPSLDILFDFWCNENFDLVNDFIEAFKNGYNEIANTEGLDYFI